MPDEPLTFPMPNTGLFDPPEEVLRMREGRPIARVRYPDGALGWIVTRHASVRMVLSDRRFSARKELRSSPLSSVRDTTPAMPGMFTAMDPPGHTRYRRLLTGQFTVRRMRRLTSRVARVAEDHLDRMAKAGPPVDLVRAYATPIPTVMISELLGVPPEYREDFLHETEQMLRQNITPQEKRQTVARLTEHVGRLVRRKHEEPGDDVLGGLVSSGELTDQEAANMGFMLLAAGLDTTANMLGLGTLALLRHPDQIPAIIDPDRVENAVEELLRYLPIIPGTIRAALEDVEVEGVRVKAGESVMVSLPGGNRDPEKYPDPDVLDLDRQAGGQLAFGYGMHQCLGQQLARVEMKVAFPALFRRFPDLSLAVPVEEVPLRTDMVIFGVHALPVTWSWTC
ncbi:cytochrome P450 [Streptomyces malaysiense]|uniref:Cytochrome n=1 Tax=Streptomyces malaysiense TaxID=1428626 RepID=A0A1J4PYR5_9ACTN|nr:cytochrome P450 [Streptomyces malaysiense]OIK25436.1 cytochrome [Streptomyces malaysiense]